MQYNKKTFIISILFIAIFTFFIGRMSKEYKVIKTEELKQINSENVGYEVENNQNLKEKNSNESQKTSNYNNNSYNKYKNYQNNNQTEYQNSNPNKEYNAKNNSSINIPDYAIETLKYIRKHNKAPENYVGGRTFQNRERLLPLEDKYQEWDVNPKVAGRNRGAERLVTSATKAYYTNNHYRSFTKIKE